MNALRVEIKTFLKSKITVVGTVAFFFLIIFVTTLSYAIGADNIGGEMAKLSGNAEKCDSLKRNLLALHPAYGINNALADAIAIGLIIFPILSATFVGTDYSLKTIYLKLEIYKLRVIILSKTAVIMAYLILMTILTAGLGLGLSHLLWNIYILPIHGISAYIPKVSNSTNLWFILATFFAILFYSMIAVLIALIFKNSVAGVAASLLFCFFEEYVKFRFMPRWLFFNIWRKIFFSNEFTTAQYKLPSSMAGTPLHICVILLIVYFLFLIMVPIIIISVLRKFRKVA